MLLDGAAAEPGGDRKAAPARSRDVGPRLVEQLQAEDPPGDLVEVQLPAVTTVGVRDRVAGLVDLPFAQPSEHPVAVPDAGLRNGPEHVGDALLRTQAPAVPLPPDVPELGVRPRPEAPAPDVHEDIAAEHQVVAVAVSGHAVLGATADRGRTGELPAHPERSVALAGGVPEAQLRDDAVRTGGQLERHRVVPAAPQQVRL